MSNFIETMEKAKKNAKDTIDNYKLISKTCELWNSDTAHNFSSEVIDFGVKQCALYGKTYSAALKFYDYTEKLLECQKSGVDFDLILEHPSFAIVYSGNVCLEYGKPWEESRKELSKAYNGYQDLLSSMSSFCEDAVGADSEFCNTVV